MARRVLGRAALIGSVLMLPCASLVADPRIEQPDHDRHLDAENALTIFDIPSQPLEHALKAFAAVVQVELFYESAAVSGQRSFAVRGEFSAQQALRLLLQGTGLSSASFDRGTITVLARAPGQDVTGINLAKAQLARFSSYLAVVQASMDHAFCRLPIAATGPDELLARLWISSSGGISKAELLFSTGSDHDDRIYVAALSALSVDVAPPDTMPQPVNLMIMPKRSHASAVCVRQRTQLRSAAHE